MHATSSVQDHTLSPTSPSAGPELSVVVVAFVGPEYLQRLLTALGEQRTADTEIIVACDSLVGDVSAFQAQFPDVQFVWFADRRTPAELRSIGVARARGRIVALVEDHCVPASDWCTQIVAAHDAQVVAVGGAMEKGFAPGQHGDTALNWALYLADYSRYMLPLPAGPSGNASDCNVSYKRATLAEISGCWDREFHENLVHTELDKRGLTVWCSPDVIVYEQRAMTWTATLRDRFTFGRLFGSTRVQGAPATRRATMAIAALLLPPLLVFRVARNVFGKGRHKGAFVRAVGPLIVVASAWVAGEVVGYVTGRAGASLTSRAADVSP